MEQEFKVSHHRQHVKDITIKLLKSAKKASKCQKIVMSLRAEQIILSILTEPQIFECGFSSIVRMPEINPYSNLSNVILVLTPACTEQGGQIDQTSYIMQNVYLVNLSISTPLNGLTQIIKSIQFKDGHIKGLLQQNLDFSFYLANVICLSTKFTQRKQPKQLDLKKPKYRDVNDDKLIFDRLCAYLCSFPAFYEFQIFYPDETNSKSSYLSIQSYLNERMQVLKKYLYASLIENSPKIRLVIFERKQFVSPFLHSLNYGPIVEELKQTNICNLVSVNSYIYNTLYCQDIQAASLTVEKLASLIVSSKKEGVSFEDFNQMKRDLLKGYNPNLSKEQLALHQSLLDQCIMFLNQHTQLLSLEQDIANGLTSQGLKLKGSKVVSKVIKWCEANANEQHMVNYEYYLGLILIALHTNRLWWFQNNQLISGASKQDRTLIKKCIENHPQNVGINNLPQSPPKLDDDGKQVRSKLFRHQPEIVQQIKQYCAAKKPRESFKKIQINKTIRNKKVKTVIFINSIIGYNQLALLMQEVKAVQNGDDYEIVCRGLMGVQDWIKYRLDPSTHNQQAQSNKKGQSS